MMGQQHIPLDRKGLREFACLTGAVLALLFGLLLPWLVGYRLPLWPWIMAGLLVGWGLIAPISLRPVYRGWMRLGLLLSRVTTPLILAVVFFGLILPMGLVMRLIGRDPMARGFDSEAESYRVKCEKRPRKSMERPF